jgi:hypothetical protein
MRTITNGIAAFVTLLAVGAAFSALGGVASMQSGGAKATATAGNAAISNYNRADIVILALDGATGAGVSSLAPASHTGDANSVISLPKGWALDTKLVPPGGCVLQPTHIYNDGQGGYTLSVMTVAKGGACPWRRGEYHYLLRVNTQGYQGGTIGRIVID